MHAFVVDLMQGCTEKLNMFPTVDAYEKCSVHAHGKDHMRGKI